MSGKKSLSLSELIEAYDNNTNIMKLLRGDGETNSPLAVQLSYDLQAGSYSKIVEENPVAKKNRDKIGADIAGLMAGYLKAGGSVLEAGTGEGSTFAPVIRALPNVNYELFGFDIAWSRLYYADAFLKKETDRKVTLFMANLLHIPLPDNSIDVVFTSHSVEPNYGSEDAILSELYRIAKKAVILFEPTYEMANEDAKRRMESMGYCRGMPDIISQKGWILKEYKLHQPSNPQNPSAFTVIEKNTDQPENQPELTCVSCGLPLLREDGHLFCARDGVVYPVIKGISCLLPTSALIATKYTHKI